ncbi:Alkyl sulfatase C-terminal [Rhodococcus koreensis]|uniref:Alkyl sulfatase C-terminal n=2 Tax=Rhodococcus koreensis TaxID=99653 RepID=A0A1H5CJY0_9NOCA|nr:Alkyl sulfatase C-terminal [Rhodococcus koreensis]
MAGLIIALLALLIPRERPTTAMRSACLTRGIARRPPPHLVDPPTDSAGTQLTVSSPKKALAGVLLKPSSATELEQAGVVTLDGDAGALSALAAVLDDFDPSFPIVTP